MLSSNGSEPNHTAISCPVLHDSEADRSTGRQSSLTCIGFHIWATLWQPTEAAKFTTAPTAPICDCCIEWVIRWSRGLIALLCHPMASVRARARGWRLGSLGCRWCCHRWALKPSQFLHGTHQKCHCGSNRRFSRVKMKEQTAVVWRDTQDLAGRFCSCIRYVAHPAPEVFHGASLCDAAR